jgi:hypothetical protein
MLRHTGSDAFDGCGAKGAARTIQPWLRWSSMTIESQLLSKRLDTRHGSLVKLWGVVDNFFDTVDLKNPSEGLLVLDLDGVPRASSFGVRAWMAAMRGTGPGIVHLARVRPEMMRAFNLSKWPAKNVRLVSIYLPLHCDACDHDQDQLVDVTKCRSVQEVPAAPCERCGGVCELDEIATSYFVHVVWGQPVGAAVLTLLSTSHDIPAPAAPSALQTARRQATGALDRLSSLMELKRPA